MSPILQMSQLKERNPPGHPARRCQRQDAGGLAPEFHLPTRMPATSLSEQFPTSVWNEQFSRAFTYPAPDSHAPEHTVILTLLAGVLCRHLSPLQSCKLLGQGQQELQKQARVWPMKKPTEVHNADTDVSTSQMRRPRLAVS